MRFVQLLHVPGFYKQIWALDVNGEIWECLDKRGTDEEKPLTWQRLEFGKPAYIGESSRVNERISGAEKFRAAVLKYIRNIQVPGEPMHDLAGEIESLDILEALGLK